MTASCAKTVIAVSFVLFFTARLTAQPTVVHWTGPSTGDWESSDNWGDSSQGVPTESLNEWAIIDSGATVVIDETVTSPSDFGLYNGTILHESGGHLSVNDGSPLDHVVGGGGTGIYDMRGGSLTLDGSSWWIGAYGGLGCFRHYGGTVVNGTPTSPERMVLGNWTAGAVGEYYLGYSPHTLEMSCSAMDPQVEENSPSLTASWIELGNDGSGLFVHSSGTFETRTRVEIGAASSGSGKYWLRGDDAVLNAGSYVEVGSQGVFHLDAGHVQIGTYLLVGSDTNSDGEFVMRGGALSFSNSSTLAAASNGARLTLPANNTQLDEFSDVGPTIDFETTANGADLTTKTFEIVEAPPMGESFNSLEIGVMDPDDGNLVISLSENAFADSLEINGGLNHQSLGAHNLFFESTAFSGFRALLPGDANLDGVVDDADGTIWANSFFANATGADATWQTGDFDGNRIVDIFDGLILGNYHGTGPVTPPAGVPEPAIPALMLLGLAAAMGRLRPLQ